MDKLVRREFTGSWIIFTFLCLSGIGLPFAVLYLVGNTIEIHTELQDAETALEKIRKRQTADRRFVP